MADLKQMDKDVAEIRQRLAKAENVQDAALAAYDGMERLMTEMIMELSRIRKTIGDK